MEFKKKNQQTVLEEKVFCLEDGSELPLLYYPLLEKQKWLTHCFTTRQGGVSKGVCSSLNLSFTRGDEPEAVKENFRRLAEALGVEEESFVFSDQTHTTNVRKITKEDSGNGLAREKSFFDTDGLITDEPGLVLSTFYADCVPLYFVDTVHKAIGLSHSGWRGTVGRIGQVTIEAMGREYGTRPEDLLCAIGPSICQDCYEISEDVAVEFQRLQQECSRSKNPEVSGAASILKDKGNGKYLLDLWRANGLVLMEAGVPKEQIATTNLCTCCNSELLFSHRASQGRRGNLGAFLMIRKEV